MFDQWRAWPTLPTVVKVGAAPLKSICQRMPLTASVSTLSGVEHDRRQRGLEAERQVPILRMSPSPVGSML